MQSWGVMQWHTVNMVFVAGQSKAGKVNFSVTLASCHPAPVIRSVRILRLVGGWCGARGTTDMPRRQRGPRWTMHSFV